MRILYLHQFFITREGVGGTRSYEFARRFAARGHGVRMVTAGGGLRDQEGIEVVGVRGAYSDYMAATALSYPRRMLAFARFAVGSTLAALRGPRPDVILATSPPLTMALPALAASVRHRTPFVFEVRDLWPEAPIQMGALRGRTLQWLARTLERFVYARAASVVALSPGIRDGIVAAGVPAAKVELVPNASDLELFSPDLDGREVRERLGLGDRFVCSYFGAMGEANDLTQVVEAGALLEQRGEDGVRFVLMGEGKRRAELEELARARGARNVVFADPVPDKSQVARLAAASDACLTVFKDVPVLATNSPNKLFDTFAAGRPAIVNTPGWMRELVEANEAGLFARPGDAADLAEKVLLLRDRPELADRYGRNARALAEREFDRDRLAARLLALLERVAARR
ncbi:MAG TPA: glycosyltransferase family 4 protein [Thermoleophilaceae bacterium]|nr:glycosyltransferase family 4 protein [Thermoleophilaceae bacterium]